MYPTEVMGVLRTLNVLDKERQGLTAGSAAAVLIERHRTAAREQLPDSILALHDRFAARGQQSVVSLVGSSCSACHLKLPSGVLGDLRTPGRFSMCPNCSVFVWSGEQPSAEVVVPAKKTSRKKAYA